VSRGLTGHRVLVFPLRQLEQERTEKQELKRELKVLQRAKDSILCDLRHSNHQLQVELALAQVFTPLPSPLLPTGLALFACCAWPPSLGAAWEGLVGFSLCAL